MSTLKKFTRYLKPEDYKYKYKTQADVKDLTFEEIARLNPDDVSSKLRWIDGGVKLTKSQTSAVWFLCNFKRFMALTPQANREAIISDFIDTERERQASEKTAGPLIGQPTDQVAPKSPSDSPITWPVETTDHVLVGGKWKTTKSRRTKSRRTKSRRTKSRRTKSRRKR